MNRPSVCGKIDLDTDVQIGTIKVRLSITGGVGFLVTSASGSINVHASGYTYYGASQTYYGWTNNNNVTVGASTPVSVLSWTGTTAQNNTIYCILNDISNGRTYIISGIIRTSSSCFLSISQIL